MYILFINLGGKCDIFFSTQFNNNSNKKNGETTLLVPKVYPVYAISPSSLK